jgi:PIN domain nuclease of toxin-antitoxin system
LSVLLDTHLWIWWVNRGPELTDSERAALANAAEAGEVALSAISLWEAQMLHAGGRLQLEVPFDAWLLQTAAPSVVRVIPLDVAVVLALDKLPPSFHGDPADRIIVATARAWNLPLATHDRAIRRSRTVRLWAA